MTNSRTCLPVFREDQAGSIGPMFALMTMPLVMILGCAVDYGQALKLRTQMRTAVDAAAIAAAALPDDATKDSRESLAKASAKTNLPTGLGASISASYTEPRIVVTASKSFPTSFLRIANINSLDLSTTAAAERTAVAATGKICLLALDPESTDGVHIQGTNTMDYTGCWAHTNSTKSTAMNANGSNAKATGAGNSAVGGFEAPFNNFTPTPKTGQAAIADPFATVSSYPTISAHVPTYTIPYNAITCKANGLKLKKGTYTLSPGKYCGGLTVMAQAKVTFEPGTYVIDNGTFDVQSGATANGRNVLFYLQNSSKFQVIGSGSVDLIGRTTGSTNEGFLMIVAPDSLPGETSRIQGGSSVKVEGVIYAPRQRLEVGGDSESNANSKFFGMVAKDFYLIGNGKFYFKPHNSTDLPDIMPKMPATGGAKLIGS